MATLLLTYHRVNDLRESEDHRASSRGLGLSYRWSAPAEARLGLHEQLPTKTSHRALATDRWPGFKQPLLAEDVSLDVRSRLIYHVASTPRRAFPFRSSHCAANIFSMPK